MKYETIFLLLSNALFAIAWIWGLFTMSHYIKKGKGWAFALTPFWVLTDSWFNHEGIPYLKKVRVIISITFLLFISAIFIVNNT